MAEYTYKDIIIDPISEEAKNAIDKEVYFADTPASCLNAAKNNNKAYLGYLKKLDLGDEEQPFYVNEFVVSAPSSWTCIIVKKEEESKYVPFESKEEFIEAFHYHDNSKYSKTDDILMNYGMWIKSMCLENFYQVTIIKKSGIFTDDNCSIVTWKQLLEKYTFLDRSPCGKEVKDE